MGSQGLQLEEEGPVHFLRITRNPGTAQTLRLSTEQSLVDQANDHEGQMDITEKNSKNERE